MPAANGTDAQIGQAVELARIAQLLHALLAETRSELLELAVHDGRGREIILENFPVAGAKRVLAYRTGNVGSDSFAVPASSPGVLVTPAHEGRLGGQIVNSGASPVVLYLTERPVPAAGVPAVWLASAGGTWDFRLGNMLWCGNVSAVGSGGASTLTVATV